MSLFSFWVPDVVEALERVCGDIGYHASIRVDQGSEFISRELDLWAYTLVASRKACGVRQVDLAERLGKPQSYVSKVERGERGLDVGEYVAWMHAIGLNPSALLAILLDPDEDEEDDDDWHYVLQRLGAKPVSD